jgi:hypothetical protein
MYGYKAPSWWMMRSYKCFLQVSKMSTLEVEQIVDLEISIVNWSYFTASLSAMRNLIYYFDGFFLLSFMLWYVGIILSSYFLPFIYIYDFHLISRCRWQPNCDKFIITKSSRRLQSKTKFRYGILYKLRVLTFTEQNNK